MCVEGTVRNNAIAGIGYEMVFYGDEKPNVELEQNRYEAYYNPDPDAYWDDFGQ